MDLSRLARMTAILLIPALLSNNLAFAAKKPVDPVAMKAKVQARGVGQGVRVNMAGGTETKGVIVSIGAQSASWLSPREQPSRRRSNTRKRQACTKTRWGPGPRSSSSLQLRGGIVIVAAILLRGLNGFKLKGPIL
jgi:hypothetical protein